MWDQWVLKAVSRYTSSPPTAPGTTAVPSGTHNQMQPPAEAHERPQLTKQVSVSASRWRASMS